MSVARNASATTSLPNPAALTPAGTGRSKVDNEPPTAGRAFALSLLLLDTVFGWSSTARRAERRHPTGLRALTQSGEQFQPGIAIGRVHADLFLVGENGLDRVAPGTAVNAIGFEALLVEATLNFLDFVQCRRALPAWELLMERRPAADEVAEVAERQGVAARRVVRVDRAEILSDQKRRPTRYRQPKLHMIARPWKCRAVGAAYPEILPFGVGAHCTIIGKLGAPGRDRHLASPGFASPIVAAFH